MKHQKKKSVPTLFLPLPKMCISYIFILTSTYLEEATRHIELQNVEIKVSSLTGRNW